MVTETALADAERYFNGKVFISKILADELFEENDYATLEDTKEIFIFRAGVWKAGAETFIEAEVADRLGDLFTIHRANEVIGYMRAQTYRERKNPPTELVCMENGIFNIATAVLEPHSVDHFFVNKLPVKYDEESECPKFLKFLSEVVQTEDIPVLQEMFGYCLYREYPFHKAFMMLGQGQNGKSTLINVLCAMLGDENITSVPLQAIVSNRFAAAGLYGKMANLYPDLSAKGIKETGMFKVLTGGDTIGAEQKFKNSFLFKNYAKMIFSANKLPEANDDTDAYHRRWIFINFPNKFEGVEQDRSLSTVLVTPEELSGIFVWAVKGLLKLTEKNDFSHSLSTEEAREFYQRASSPVQAFVLDMVVENSEGFVPKEELYATFIQYCKRTSLPTLSQNLFVRKLKESVVVLEERRGAAGSRIRGWKGISLKDSGSVGSTQKTL